MIAQTGQGERVNLSAVLSELARRDVNEVLVEAGPTLTGALLQQGLIDELICYVAPRLLGDEARPMARLPGIETLDASMKVQTTDVRQIGSDLRLTLRPLGRGEG